MFFRVLTDCVSPGVFLDHLYNSEILPVASSLLKPLVVWEALSSMLLEIRALIKRIKKVSTKREGFQMILSCTRAVYENCASEILGYKLLLYCN